MTPNRSSGEKHPFSSLSILWFFYILFIFYGTLIPFNLCPQKSYVLWNISQIRWLPFIDADGSRASLPDVVQNILFFLPFGFLGYFLKRGKSTFKTLLLVSLYGGALSLLVEFCQLFTIDRTTSATDLVTNTMGAFCGAVLARYSRFLFQRRLTGLPFWKKQHQHAMFLLLVAVTFVGLSALQPFDFTLDVGQLWSRIKMLMAAPVQFHLPLRDEGVVFLEFFLLGLALSHYLRFRNPQHSVVVAAIIAAGIGLALEGTQLIVSSRLPEVQDALVIVFAGALGAVSYTLKLSRIPKSVLKALLILATAVAIGIQTWSPFTVNGDFTPFNWLPFRSYYERTTFVALSNFLESLFSYFPFGFVWQLLAPREKNAWLNILLIALVLSFILEVLQGRIAGRYPDITDVLGAVLGAVAGARIYVDGWKAFKSWAQQMRNSAHTA